MTPGTALFLFYEVSYNGVFNCPIAVVASVTLCHACVPPGQNVFWNQILINCLSDSL